MHRAESSQLCHRNDELADYSASVVELRFPPEVPEVAKLWHLTEIAEEWGGEEELDSFCEENMFSAAL